MCRCAARVQVGKRVTAVTDRAVFMPPHVPVLFVVAATVTVRSIVPVPIPGFVSSAFDALPFDVGALRPPTQTPGKLCPLSRKFHTALQDEIMHRCGQLDLELLVFCARGAWNGH